MCECNGYRVRNTSELIQSIRYTAQCTATSYFRSQNRILINILICGKFIYLIFEIRYNLYVLRENIVLNTLSVWVFVYRIQLRHAHIIL